MQKEKEHNYNTDLELIIYFKIRPMLLKITRVISQESTLKAKESVKYHIN